MCRILIYYDCKFDMIESHCMRNGRQPRHRTRMRAGTGAGGREGGAGGRAQLGQAGRGRRRRSARRAARRSSVAIDLSSHDSIKEAFAKVPKEFGRVDILVNNAGLTRDGLALRMKPDDWDAVLQTNLSGAFLCIQQVLPAMMRERWGTDREYLVGGGRVGQRGPGELCGVESGPDRADEIAGAGDGIAQHHGERRCAGFHRDRYDRGASSAS